MRGAVDLFTIGHSNIPADRFVGLLTAQAVTAVADVRSVPFSRRFPWFSGKAMAERLQGRGIAYIAMGDTLGGRPDNPALYCDGIADYETMSETKEFRSGLDHVIGAAEQHRVCLMCSEREPLDCHRCLLVARALAERGGSVGHILHDGSVEPHAATEDRLLALAGHPADLFGDRTARLADAYRRRARKIAARLPDRRRNRTFIRS